MGTVRLGSYLEGVQADLAPTVAALHQAIVAARPDLAVTESLGMLTYGLNHDFRHWVCSIGISEGHVTLRFLPGAYMRDPEMILKPGVGGIRMLDIDSHSPVDAERVGAYVNEAVIQLGAYKQG